MSRSRLLIVGLLIGLMPMLLSSGVARKVVVHVETVPLAWGESRINDLLLAELSRNPELIPVVARTGHPLSPPPPTNRYEPESWLDFGTEVGGRYLLTVFVDREGLERRKTFSVPILFQRWETIGLITGEVRLYDLQKRRLLAAEQLKLERSGARQFQGSTDNNRNDPSLHISAPDKSRFFAELEAELARDMNKLLKKYTRGR